MIYLGNNEILGVKLGNTDISAIYAGDLLIYPTTVTAWSVTPSQIEVKRTGGNEKIRIASLSAWTISSSESWVTFSQNSGDSGRTTVVATISDYSSGETDRTATITVTDGTNTSTVSVIQKASAGLPNVAFMFNYNVKEMYSGSGTYIIPKTQGQLFDNDITLNGGVTAHTEDGWAHITSYAGYRYPTNSDNPFNRDASHNSFTFIYKTSGFTSGSDNLFGNRDNSYNYMVRGNMFHTSQSGFLSLTPNSFPEICLIRIYADGTSERKFLDSNGNVLQSTSAASISWGSESMGFAFFAGYRDGGEPFKGDFYWMYCSLETLTDAQVLDVIRYNEEL